MTKTGSRIRSWWASIEPWWASIKRIMAGSLVPALIGAILGPVIMARYAAYHESQVVAEALRAEIATLLDLLSYRRHHTYIEKKIETLKEEKENIDLEDVVAIRISGEYFTVFNATASKIGGLPPEVAAEVVRTYTLAKSVIEDIKELREIHQIVLADKKPPIMRARLRDFTIEMQTIFERAECQARLTVPKLGEYSSRWWIIDAILDGLLYPKVNVNGMYLGELDGKARHQLLRNCPPKSIAATLPP